MIIFFSSCELVEFHYHLFVQTLLSCSGAPASEQPPSASSRLKFLRLHGDMQQEVSTRACPHQWKREQSCPAELELILQGQRWLPSQTPLG